MIAILENLTSFMTLLAGYVLGDLILALRTPAGFIVIFLLITFIGQLIFQSVLKDIKMILGGLRLKNINKFNNIKSWTQQSSQISYSLSLVFFWFLLQ